MRLRQGNADAVQHLHLAFRTGQISLRRLLALGEFDISDRGVYRFANKRWFSLARKCCKAPCGVSGLAVAGDADDANPGSAPGHTRDRCKVPCANVGKTYYGHVFGFGRRK
jgi:hypothetical protein